MNRAEVYGYRLTGHPTMGFSLDALRLAQAYPAASDDAGLIHRLILAGWTGDYSKFEAQKDVSIGLSSLVPTNTADFAVIVDCWRSYGWEVMVYHHDRDRDIRWDPSDLDAYGLRR